MLSKVKGHIEHGDHEPDEGLDSNVGCDTEESSPMESFEWIYRKVRLVEKNNIQLMQRFFLSQLWTWP